MIKRNSMTLARKRTIQKTKIIVVTIAVAAESGLLSQRSDGLGGLGSIPGGDKIFFS
jgi:hypothetical protein